MHTRVINIREQLHIKNFVEEHLSFKPFIKYLKNRIGVEKTIKSQFYQLVLNKFKNYPNLKTDFIEPQDAAKYVEILELVYTILSPTIDDEKTLFWALGTPAGAKIVFSTDAFSGLVKEQNKQDKKARLSDKEFKQNQLNFIYRLILQRLYNFPDDLINDSVYALPDVKTNLTKYYRVHIDTRFIDVTHNKPLPELNPEVIEPFIYEGADTMLLKNIIPLNMFSMEGFSVITIEDITAEHSIETIRLALINNTGQNDLYKEVINSLQTLAGNAVINFGLLPFLRINGRLIFDTQECCNSILIQTRKNQQDEGDAFNNFISSYIKKPEAMFFNTLSAQKISKYPFLKALKEAGITSYAILPVFYNKHLAGILEIYAAQRVLFYEKLLSQIQAAIPLVSQLLHNTAEQLNEKLEEVIKTKFTTLQPSVQWKFNEAAWHYLFEGQKNERPEIEIVSFRNLYPLYGAIDIRDSTIYHNRALKNDIGTLINVLNTLVKELKIQISNKRIVSALLSKQTLWIKKIKEFEKANDETMLKDFLQCVVTPYLFNLIEKYPSGEKLINTYTKSIDETGETFKNRRELETSIKHINKTLSNYFDQAQGKLQKIYPCYFEKFRSDGIEYDIYTGQDITPEIPFGDKHLKDFRYWQLKAMIDVARLTNALMEKMPVPLQTASLIFVHSNQIDICFRNDERRFDVEGYYNIRYEVIKKRIDKVHIKNTKERLTQPGKIALVYFNNVEADEYIALIKQFQKDKSLKKDIEFIELENLQGVTGLKALRVSINLTNVFSD
ncbi:GAF domain-containing protein [Mucilaginibacter sp.]|uniref:GAF domain-containing protein n=1 Tax=Mucilaginibacter sp. TaxID=1882438 RepID=UPI00261DA1A8|nr:GAF domain-containing protein [Mucilaginibacter sp.]MDB5030765.1 hypothetical protein [Mucilaginibacter sp.]